MAINMTNTTYEIRYFLNGKQYCDKRHCFNFGKHLPFIPQVGERVALDTVRELCFDNDEYVDMPMHYYEVLGITYNMDELDSGDFPMLIDIEVVDVTDEVMDECEDDDDCCPCMSFDCKGDC